MSIALWLEVLSVASAQIPNAGFEVWTSGVPVSWNVNNIPSYATPISQSSDVHSGNSAMQGTVVSFESGAFRPLATAGFAVGGRYNSLSGYYKFSPQGGDALQVILVLFKSGNSIGGGNFNTVSGISNYVQFIAPIAYSSLEIPDSASIEIVIIAPSGTTHVGSSFKIDDLAFIPATGVQETLSTRPTVYALSQNYPNPFNPLTEIAFELPQDTYVNLEVFNVLGKHITTLVNGVRKSGNHSVRFNGAGLSSGVYFYRFHAGGYAATRKLLLLK